MYRCKLRVLKELCETFGQFAKTVAVVSFHPFVFLYFALTIQLRRLLSNFSIVLQRNKEMAREISAQVKQQCFAKHDSFETVADTFAPTLPEQFQCLADVLGDASKANGLEEMWTKAQPELQLHIDNWMKCAEEQDNFMVL